MTTVYEVVEKQLSTGTRIEGFDIKTTVFKSKAKALAYATKTSNEYIKNYSQDHNEINFTNVDIAYVSECGGGYEYWPDFNVYITPRILDLEEDIVYQSTYRDETR